LQLKAKSNSTQTIILCESRRYSLNIKISSSDDVKISGLTFSGCQVEFTGVNNTFIRESNFEIGALRFTSSINVTIDKCRFSNNSKTSLVLKSTSGVHCTRSTFSNNTASIISVYRSVGFIGCSNFYNNSAFSDLILMNYRSTLSVSNCTFDNNTVSHSVVSILRLVSSGDNLVVTNSTFSRSNVHFFSRAVIKVDHPEASVTVIATNFIGNGGRNSIAPIRSDSSDVAIYCSSFINLPLPIKYMRQRNISYCQQNTTSMTCRTSGCKREYDKCVGSYLPYKMQQVFLYNMFLIC